MQIMRSTDWQYLGVVDGLLKFKSVKYKNEYYLTPKAKFFDVKLQQAKVLSALPVTGARKVSHNE